jgi:stress response protein YsnF
MIKDWTPMTQLADSLDDGRETVPLVEEQAVVRKRKRLTGGVRIRTVVHDDEQVVDAPLRAEQVEVKRVALDDHWVEAPIPVRQEGDTTIVTLHEEVVVGRDTAAGHRGGSSHPAAGHQQHSRARDRRLLRILVLAAR